MKNQKISWLWIRLMVLFNESLSSILPILKTIVLNTLIMAGSYFCAKLVIWNWSIENPAQINLIWFSAVFTTYLFINNQLKNSHWLLVVSNLGLINTWAVITLLTLFILNRFGLIRENMGSIFSWPALVGAILVLSFALENWKHYKFLRANRPINKKRDTKKLLILLFTHTLPKAGFAVLLTGLVFYSIGTCLKPEFDYKIIEHLALALSLIGFIFWLSDILIILFMALINQAGLEFEEDINNALDSNFYFQNDQIHF